MLKLSNLVYNLIILYFRRVVNMADSTPGENDFEFKIHQNNAGNLKITSQASL